MIEVEVVVKGRYMSGKTVVAQLIREELARKLGCTFPPAEELTPLVLNAVLLEEFGKAKIIVSQIQLRRAEDTVTPEDKASGSNG